jgi:carboxyl-terminal processing protease
MTLRSGVRLIGAIVVAVVFMAAVQVPARAQPISRLERGRVKQMLKSIGDELKKNYYDPSFGGRDIDTHLRAAQQKIDAATSLGHGLAIVAQALVDLNDSHTFFVPPNRTVSVEYGWRMQMVGDACLVVAVKPDSDAAAKGLKAGDQVIAIDGFPPSRAELWKVEYTYRVLRPRTGVTLVVKSPGGSPRQLAIASKLTESKRLLDLTGGDGGLDLETFVRDTIDARPRHFRQQLQSIAIWKMPDFTFTNADEMVDWAVGDAAALILDLRGNPGGYVKTLEQVVGRLFDRDVKIADLKGRKTMKPMQAKKGRRAFDGRIVALTDSRTGSAGELLARVLQIERRGTVVGDRSSGSVMQSYGFTGQMGVERMVFYGASITNADVIMSDGKSLERVGVVPDEAVVPSAEDLAAARDPVLARAAALLDVPLDAGAAGQLFPRRWTDEGR